MSHPDDLGHASILSPEAVELDLAVASPAPRILAYGVDVFIVGLIWSVILVLGIGLLQQMDWFSSLYESMGEAIEADPGSEPDVEELFSTAFLFLSLLFGLYYFLELAYFVFWEWITRGSSPGKKLVGLRVVGEGGIPVDLRSILLRNLLRGVDLLPPGSYAVGLVTMLISRKGQRLGDHVAGTLVIREDRPERGPDIQVPPGVEPLPLTREQAGRLGADELALLRRTLRRVSSLGVGRRMQLTRQIAQSFCDRLELEQQTDEDPERLLQRIWLAAERLARQR